MQFWNTPYHLSNRSRVLRYIVRKQPISRSTIVEALNLPRSLVTAITGDLIADGLVTELGKEKNFDTNNLGRKRLLLGLVPDSRYSIGIEITVNKFMFCLCNLAGELISSFNLEITTKELENINRTLLSGIKQLLSVSGADLHKIIGIGIALPGHLDRENGTLLSHANYWSTFNLNELAKLSNLNLPITAENNVRCMAYDKYLFDSKNCPENFAFLHIGAGIFCADFRNGLLSDGSYISGEIGHTIVNPEGNLCECGKIGCLQSYASDSCLIKKAQLLFTVSTDTVLHKLVNEAAAINMNTLLSAYKLGDTFVVGSIKEALRYIAVSAANSAIVLGSEKLYLHSRLCREELLSKEVDKLIKSHLHFFNNLEGTTVELLTFAENRAAIGAAALAIDRLLIRGK